MAKNKEKKISEKLTASDKNIKRELIFADIAMMVLGLLMVILPKQSADVICIAAGIFLGIWGLIKLVTYFASKKTAPFTSFGLVEGATLAGFAVFFILSPQVLKEFLEIVLAIVLLISAVMKLQYTVDFLRLKEKFWYIPLIGAAVSIALGVLIFIDPFNNHGLMLFIGISYLVNGLWDIISVLVLSNASQTLSLDDDKKSAEKEPEKLTETAESTTEI
ncbi:MAG: DUF308 domain-containing protein [Ruminococcus sp.]|nr:DUF308 domain-containing protein [Ruminococcus sp.]